MGLVIGKRIADFEKDCLSCHYMGAMSLNLMGQPNGFCLIAIAMVRYKCALLDLLIVVNFFRSFIEQFFS